MGLDKLVDKIVALGVPGLVLLIAMSASGWAGAAALTTALAFLGGPLGMLGGIAVLGILALFSKGVANYGFESIYSKVLQRLKDEEGLTEDELIEKINNYPISRGLKLKLIDKIESQR
jgi:hypothetical protein|tara:strand:+ start:121 stop:474 length:354 start_codon:yes stop_codon:yes gene_type:complete